MDAYQQYLNELHARIVTPDPVISDVVREATGKSVLGKTRIVAGEVNEVYDVVLSDRSQVIVRIARQAGPAFAQERWAIDRCCAAGVPVPVILSIRHLTLDGEQLHFCVQQKLEGDTLERGGINFQSFSEDRKQKIIFQAGEILSRIHSVKTAGFGKLDGAGKGAFKTFADLMAQNLPQEESFMAVAGEIGFAREALGKLFRVLRDKHHSCPSAEPFLSHSDYGPKHIMLKNDAISGILDFGDVSGHSPIQDFAKWDYWYGESIPLAWLKAGYANQALFSGAQFEETLHWFRLNNGLGVLWWYYEQGYAEGVSRTKEKLYQDLSFYD